MVDAKSHITEITPADLRVRLDDNKGVVLLDVREDNEWAKGHFEEAKHLGKGVIERDIEKLYPNKDTQIVLHCGNGSRSSIACD